jgi:hypothetical protein
MDVVSRIKGFFRAREATEPPPTDPQDMRQHIRDAYALLVAANKNSVQVPPDIITVITAARKANSAELPDGLEAEFWNTYGLLNSSIHPAQRARRFYRNVFYVVLVALLLSQFYFGAGDYVRTKVASLDNQLHSASSRVQVATSTGVVAQPAENSTTNSQATSIGQIVSQQSAYFTISYTLLHPLNALSGSTLDNTSTSRLIIQGELEMLLAFLSGYLLPMLYGLLGACAFVLRKLSDQIEKVSYVNDARAVYSLRLNIGMLSGLAVGWFIKTGSGADATLTSLPPLALAFIAGYGSDLFFAALDKIVQAFTPAPAANSTPAQALSAIKSSANVAPQGTNGAAKPSATDTSPALVIVGEAAAADGKQNAKP